MRIAAIAAIFENVRATIDRAAFVHVRHRRRVVRIVDVVVIRLVDQHRHAGRQAVEQLLDLLLGDDRAGRVVRVADVDEAELGSGASSPRR